MSHRSIRIERFVALAICSVLLPVGAIASAGAADASSAPTGSSGGNVLPAPLLALSAKEAIDTATSVRLSGTVDQVPRAYSINVMLFANGDSTGTVGIDGTTAQVTIIGNWYYIKGSAKFWTQTFQPAPGNAAKFASVWVAVPRSSMTGLGANLSMAHLRNGFGFSSNVQLTNIGVSQVANQRSIGLLISGKGKLWIAATAPYRPVAFNGTNDGNLVALQFSDWNKGPTPAVPSGPIQYT